MHRAMSNRWNKPRITSYVNIRQLIDAARKGGRRRLGASFLVRRRVAQLVIADLEAHGKFYHDGQQTYYFFNLTKHLLEIRPDHDLLRLLLRKYGLLQSEPPFNSVLDEIQMETLENGQHVKVHTLSHYDRNSNTLYLHNLATGIFRFQPNDVTLFDNGGNGVLFVQRPGWTSYNWVELNTNHSAFEAVMIEPINFSDGDLTVDDQRHLFRVWFYSLFFPELFPTRPILALVGSTKSGKTSVLRKVGRLLFGPSFNVTQISEKPTDFDVAVANQPFVAVDNADTQVRWLDDRLAVAATGGSYQRRVLYKDNILAEWPITAFIGITSRTPHFRREDVANRLLILHLQSIDEVKPESLLLAELEEKRDVIMSEVIDTLPKILCALREKEGHIFRSQFRMADFADFALKVSPVLGCSASRMEHILDMLMNVQSTFTMEDEPTFLLISEWLAVENGRNLGCEMSTAELCNELAKLSITKGIEFDFREKTRAFGKWLSSNRSTLKEHFGMAERKGRAKTRYLKFRSRPSPLTGVAGNEAEDSGSEV